MKTFIYSLLMVSCIALNAQTYDLYNRASNIFLNIPNAYYKDLTNVHDQYIGTWLYTNGNTSLKLVFEERAHVKENLNYYGEFYYADWLIGEGQYIENGVEKWNSLNNLSASQGTDVITVRDHSSFYSGSYTKERMYCPECAPNERRLKMYWTPQDSNFNIVDSDLIPREAILRRFFENGVEKLKITFYVSKNHGMIVVEDDNTPIPPSVIPLGSYILTKQ